MSIQLKKQLFEFCQTFVDQKIDLTQQAIQEIQEEANKETKSSAGDKYETGRAMLHLEKDKHSRQLATYLQLKQTLQLVQAEYNTQKVGLGSLVYTSIGHFYIAISAGKYTETTQEIHCISLASPIGQALANCKAEESILFRDKKISILEVL